MIDFDGVIRSRTAYGLLLTLLEECVVNVDRLWRGTISHLYVAGQQTQDRPGPVTGRFKSAPYSPGAVQNQSMPWLGVLGIARQA
jgi:hypothetical protein